MTLHKSIEAARKALISISNRGNKNKTLALTALSTLPAKPMTEEEIVTVILNNLHDGMNTELEIRQARSTIRALRDAGVLYVEGE